MLASAQSQADKHRKIVDRITVEGRSKSGYVTVKSSGDLNLEQIDIKDELLSKGTTEVQDEILSALNDVAEKTYDQMEQIQMRMMRAR
jgi:DNA-binding protein YbaB